MGEMRTLIDGYNLMHAVGLLSRRLGPAGFRKVRHRFLNDLAARLDPVEAHQTTVVFDAAAPPDGAPRELRHKGMTILFAVADDDADERIESLIAHHSAPKGLTVVSSDHRLRQAATRRKARAVTSEDYWSELESRGARQPEPPLPPTVEETARLHGLSPDEAAYWLNAFRDLAEEPATRDALRGEPAFWTDEEIAQIEREVEEEF